MVVPAAPGHLSASPAVLVVQDLPWHFAFLPFVVEPEATSLLLAWPPGAVAPKTARISVGCHDAVATGHSTSIATWGPALYCYLCTQINCSDGHVMNGEERAVMRIN